MSDFVLRDLVREVLHENNLTDPGDIAEEVLRRIPRGNLRVALGQALRLYVRQINSEGRNRSPDIPAVAAPNQSWKVAGVRDGWQRRLRVLEHVGGSTYKPLANCTYEDLLFCATERRALAERNSARARQYDAWARLLTEHDVKTFGELPAETQLSALGRAA